MNDAEEIRKLRQSMKMMCQMLGVKFLSINPRRSVLSLKKLIEAEKVIVDGKPFKPKPEPIKAKPPKPAPKTLRQQQMDLRK